MKDSFKHISSLIAWYIPIILVQVLGSSVTMGSINPWYQTLKKTAWNPPAWLFGPVWTLLYIMMGLSIWKIYLAIKWTRVLPYVLFFAQLIANGIWSPLFFGLHSPFLAMLDLALLIALIIATIVCFFRIDKTAGWLLVPYLIWCCYALSLNIGIWLLNR